MFDEEVGRVVPKRISLGDSLAILSIGDLMERREALLAEIERVDAELASKRAGREAAEAVFFKA